MPTVSNGTTFAVCQARPATVDLAGFSALAYTQIRGVRSLGDIGKQYQTATANPIGAPRPYQRRTGLAAATLPLELFRIADPGQAILRAAVDASESYSYRRTSPDGATDYFTAKVSSRMGGGNSPGSIADTKVTLEIDSAVIEA